MHPFKIAVLCSLLVLLIQGCALKEELPQEIYRRKKISFDVGSGLQKMMVDICREKGINENDYLKNIWNDFFQKTLSECASDSYFYTYPAFDAVIPERGKKYL